MPAPLVPAPDDADTPGASRLLGLALQEMVMAVWLIVKGCNPSAIAAGSPETGRDGIP